MRAAAQIVLLAGTATALHDYGVYNSVTKPCEEQIGQDGALGWTIAHGICAAEFCGSKCHDIASGFAGFVAEKDTKTCDQHFARLCTSVELEAMAPTSQACDTRFDVDKLVWSGDECTPDAFGDIDLSAPAVKAYKVAKITNSLIGHITSTQCMPITDQKAVVRCCTDADHVHDDNDHDHDATAAPQSSTSTFFGCAELTWTGDTDNSEICAANFCNKKFEHQSHAASSGSLADRMDYPDASALCDSRGARLCTYAELTHDGNSDTACKQTDAAVWTSTPCTDSTQGGGAELGHVMGTWTKHTNPAFRGQCFPPGQKNYVRCCASEVAAGFTGWDATPNTPAPTPVVQNAAYDNFEQKEDSAADFDSWQSYMWAKGTCPQGKYRTDAAHVLLKASLGEKDPCFS
jgi:hypothetical protein